ncbi:rRNA pseudouridine synthase [Corynebacterium sp. ES2794-CONJ1]|uniref:pseudouridine synthase n=1 Tax=unclassified Corynebacterium TaxID=2624378 RepID=UPI0021689893|nr:MULTISPECIES: pseudouridine synthase [unclassified Corynebacterium]MCS4491210.1 rRNA pseudouridine synthase [Corynebacterium sp. ES2715-CONJ3]MCS4530909.1 rRNA pseudouridine synthase [Corynebacterium sp. ES2730-CONJ]MCU9518274.1 rRNA pseudouridine synthase [Corynebacterium sp. ES2794-CONJ1]
MSPTARRDGTPGKPRSKRSGAQQSGRGGSGSRRKPSRSSDDKLYISNAKPARHQHKTAFDRGPVHRSEGIRLQKVLAQAGVASRRHAEVLIDQARVEVNGKIVQEQGLRVDPQNDLIRVDGVRVNVNENYQYFVLNKPRGVHSTMSDDMGRPCIGDLVSERVSAGQRLFHVGRLDAATEGLILLTNDGELANRLMHPSYKVSKTYLATVLGEADRNLVRTLLKGIELDDGPARADHVQIVDTYQGKSLIRLEIHEGRKHIVRRMLKEAGFPVQALVRTKLHNIQLGEQKPGTLRALNTSELTSLYKVVDM